jgi:N-acetylglucosamine-6-sulfatase
VTDIMNRMTVEFLEKKRSKPFALFFAHKAVHPDASQAADGTFDLGQEGGYKPAERHKDLYKGCVFPKYPNMLSPAEVVKSKPAWADAFELKHSDKARAILETLHAGDQEEIRLRAAMMASVDEGVGMIFSALERTKQLDDTMIIFLGDNGYFFGEHGLGPERRFAYEAGIRSPFIVRYPGKIRAGSRIGDLVICQDIAPTLIELAGGKPGPQVQGRSFMPLCSKKAKDWRKSFLVEYWAEQAMPWLVGMTYKAVRTDRYKYIHWVNRGRAGELDELYDLERDPWELKNLIASRANAPVRERLRRELRRLVNEAIGL